MFESANSLQELNQARIKAVQSGIDRIQINIAYNAKKKELLSKQIPFKKIPIYRPTHVDVTPIIYLPFAGKSQKKNTIELTEGGFLC